MPCDTAEAVRLNTRTASVTAPPRPLNWRAPQPSRCRTVAVASELAQELQLAQPRVHAGVELTLFKLERCLCADEVAAALEAARLPIEVCDAMDTQLDELVRIRHPRADLPVPERKRAVRALLGAQTMAEHGVWVYYPWSRRLVHILDEAEFIEVRTNRNMYKISPAERDALASKKIGVIGLSAGQSIALAMAAERSCGELRIADFDTLDLSNLNRIRGGVHQLGVSKVVVAAREIAEIDPFLKVVCFPQGLQSGNAEHFLLGGGKLDVLFEECDSIDIKLLAREHARAHGVPVVMATSDRGLIDVERYDLESNRPILHGLVGDLRHHELAGLDYEAKVPYALKIVGPEIASTRLKASMLEIKQSAVSWPQLASNVGLGGAAAADIGRRILLREPVVSGRYFFDVDSVLGLDARSESLPHPAPAARAHLGRAERDEILRAICLPPGENLDHDVVHELVRAGGAAPSGGNTQPWRWAYGHHTLLLLRSGWDASFLDYGGLGSSVACGAAAQNVLLRASELGYESSFNAFPAGEANACVAAFSFRKRVAVWPDSERALTAQIFERHTNRKLVTRSTLPASTLAQLHAEAQSVAATQLRWLVDEVLLEKLALALGEAQQIQLQQPAGHAQLMAELRWSDDMEAQTDHTGIPVDSLDLSPLDRAGLDICRDWRVLQQNRAWGGGAGLRRMAEKSVRSAAALGLISVPGHTLRDFFQAGLALQRVWLAATAVGIGLQPISALPFMAARVHAEERARAPSLPGATAARIADLWSMCKCAFDVTPGRAGALLFRLIDAGATRQLTRRAPRRPSGEDLTLF